MFNDLEKDILKRFADDDLLFSTVKKVLLSHASLEDMEKMDHTIYNNDMLGSIARSCIVAKKIIQNSFSFMASLSQREQKPPQINEAR